MEKILAPRDSVVQGTKNTLTTIIFHLQFSIIRLTNSNQINISITIIIFQEHFPSTEKKKNPSKCVVPFTKHGTGHTIRLPPRREIQSNRDKRNPSSLSLSLSARHCFSERLIKVRKYGLEGREREREFGRARALSPPLRINDGGYRSCPRVGRGRRVVRYRGRESPLHCTSCK